MSATLELTHELISRASVTPADEGCQELMANRLDRIGFRIERCQVVHFSGDGASLSHAWCFSVRHSMFDCHRRDAGS